MKKLLTALTLIPFLAFSQKPLDYKAFQQEFETIRRAEMQAFDKMQAAGQAGDYTVASTNFDVYYARCEWTIDPAVKYIRGTITFYFSMTQASSSIVFDLSSQLTADSILYHGSPVVFLQTPDNGLQVNFPSSIGSGTRDSVSIYYQGVPDASGFGSFYQGSHTGVPVIWTLSEPYGARDWWPCKNGLNDKTDSIDIFITCPQQYQPSSNGVIVSNTVNGSNRTTHFHHGFKIASYLVALAVTNYVINTDTVVVGSQVDKYVSFAYPETAGGFFGSESWSKTAYRIFSQLFGHYPFASEKYGHTQWGWGGGMEHQTNSYVSGTSPNLSAHELAHQWFGDMITCGSWQDIWLNEGFASYNTLLFLEYGYPDFFYPYLFSAFNSAVSTPSGSVFVTDTTSVSRIFSSQLTYNKGSYVLHMLRWVVGDSAYFRGIRRYVNDPAVRFGYARTADLQRNMEQESGRDLNSFFQKWIYGEGYANYEVEWSQNANNWVKVKIKQTTSHPSVSFYEMPVNLFLINSTQEDSVVLDHRTNGQEFWINAGFKVDTILIDPYYWILAKSRKVVKIPDNSGMNEIKIYPNPTPGPLFVSLKNPTDPKLSILLFNSVGQLVFRREMDTPGRDELIDVPLSGFPRGTYILKLKSEKSINLVKKILH